uniref:Uncharacterized protein n=1 Tax=Fundulus heteroclitus TaxID=8078 RepID=A0A3Q2U444_FUNHE
KLPLHGAAELHVSQNKNIPFISSFFFSWYLAHLAAIFRVLLWCGTGDLPHCTTSPDMPSLQRHGSFVLVQGTPAYIWEQRDTAEINHVLADFLCHSELVQCEGALKCD